MPSHTSSRPRQTSRSREVRRSTALRHELSQLVGKSKPRWRGWIHLGAFPLALLGGLTLIVVSPTIGSRIAGAVFTLTGAVLFGT